jgi:TPR repeat protein
MDDEIVPLDELKSMIKYSENSEYEKRYIEKLVLSGNSKKTNDLELIMSLARCCLHGLYIQKHNDYALILYKYTANLGHSNSQQELGHIYRYGIAGIICDYDEAFEWYLMSAKQGNNQAKIDVAHMFMISRAKNCSLDQVIAYLVDAANYTAVEWYTIAAIHGCYQSQYHLGLLYNRSTTKLKNYAESLRWFKAAFANQVLVNFYYKNISTNLGEIYEYGLAVDIDLTAAIKYYKLASLDDRIKKIILENPDKIGTIICDIDDKLKDQQKILDIQDQYIVELEYIPQGPKYKAFENNKKN